jgi:pimeloyl-ACP methyl ester carboxylesterase
LAIRYAESEDRDDHALLLSPWPESVYAFEPTWLRLAELAHLVAIDLPGFGHSQRCDALLSPQAMGEFVIRLAGAFGLENPHVVGPDVGAGAALFAAALHPGRLRSLVVGSGGVAFPLQLGSRLKDWVMMSRLGLVLEYLRSGDRQRPENKAGGRGNGGRWVSELVKCDRARRHRRSPAMSAAAGAPTESPPNTAAAPMQVSRRNQRLRSDSPIWRCIVTRCPSTGAARRRSAIATPSACLGLKTGRRGEGKD